MYQILFKFYSHKASINYNLCAVQSESVKKI